MSPQRNIVLLTFDSLRADHCSFMGYERETTPTLDAMADDGVVFENAIAPASRTNPSMAGAFTGEPMVVRDQVSNPEHSRRHLERHGTIAEELSAQGYATGAFCPNAYASRYFGFDRGFDYFEDFLFDTSLYQNLFEKHISDSSVFTTLRNIRNFIRREEAFKTWDTYIDEIEKWTDAQSEPFFLWTFSLDTHFPYLTPRNYRRWSNLFDQYRYNWRCNQLIDEFNIDLSEKERQKIIDIYDDSIRYADQLIRELRERLAAYDPVFVIHSDHGESFDERGIYGHFYPSLYEENIHVPLVVNGSGVVDNTVSRPVSLLDLPQIIRKANDMSDGFGIDDRDWVISTDYDGRNNRHLTGVRTTELKFLLTAKKDGSKQYEFYKLADDPGEQRNLSGEEHQAKKPIRRLADRRRSHEREQLVICEATVQLDV